jgi:hypothetical protein
VKTLDVATKHKTEYCIPLWLRDEQVKLACELKLPRLQPQKGTRDEPIAIVCFGPSLQDTWEELRGFKQIVTCSGSHKFLLERGIVPTYHVEVDPRKHKIELLGPPHAGVKYLIASTCHPDYFKHLEGFDVTLWHIFSDDAEAHRILPRGEWALTGGSNVGLRAMTIARFFGYRDQHIFGMDGNQRDDTHKHAGAHPVQDGQGHSLVEYEGVTYKTTPAMLESAKQTIHELDMMPDVQATFHGEGMVQEMVKRRVPQVLPHKGLLAFSRPELISAEYRELNRKLHHDNLAYGVGGGRHAPTIEKLAASLKTTSVLDYGCGKGYLSRAMPYPIWEYDPAVPGKDESPRPAELVVCLDVLEHIEPDKLDFVLDDLRRVTQRVGYFVIHTGPSGKTLEDGRNAHLIQEGREWWERRLGAFFKIGKVMEGKPLLHVVVAPRSQKAIKMTEVA